MHLDTTGGCNANSSKVLLIVILLEFAMTEWLCSAKTKWEVCGNKISTLRRNFLTTGKRGDIQSEIRFDEVSCNNILHF